MCLTELCCFFTRGASVTLDLWQSPPSVVFLKKNAVVDLHAVCAWWPRFRRWRTGPARCQWNRATAARPPSTPPTTPCSPLHLPWRSWTSAGPACWRNDSESSPTGTERLLVFLCLFKLNPFESMSSAAATSCWSWWRRRGSTCETSASWWRWVQRCTLLPLLA